MTTLATAAKLATFGLAAFMMFTLAFRCWRVDVQTVWNSLGVELDLRAFRLAVLGLLASSAAMLGIFAVEAASGHLSIERIDLNWRLLNTRVALISGAVIFEELKNRVLCLSALLLVFRSPIFAVVVGAFLFGLMHAGNPDATWLSVASNSAGGLLYGWAYIATQSIWLPVGLHVGWNLAQGPLLGFPVSGYSMSAIVIQDSVEHNFLTGGSYGPEGGAIGLIFRLLLICVVVGVFRTRPQREAERM